MEHFVATTIKKKFKKIPEYLVYEIMNGKPIYYKGYKNVLKNIKQPVDIVASSSFKSFIVSYIAQLLFRNTDENFIAMRPGLQIDARNNLCGNIMVFKKEAVLPSAFSKKYIDVPAMLYIEVDVSADLGNELELSYVQKKVNKLMDFGTQRLLWIFSTTRQVLIVTKKEEWHWHSWDETLELMPGLTFNIGGYLDKEGVVLEEME